MERLRSEQMAGVHRNMSIAPTSYSLRVKNKNLRPLQNLAPPATNPHSGSAWPRTCIGGIESTYGLLGRNPKYFSGRCFRDCFCRDHRLLLLVCAEVSWFPR